MNWVDKGKYIFGFSHCSIIGVIANSNYKFNFFNDKKYKCYIKVNGDDRACIGAFDTLDEAKMRIEKEFNNWLHISGMKVVVK